MTDELMGAQARTETQTHAGAPASTAVPDPRPDAAARMSGGSVPAIERNDDAADE